MFWKSAQVTAAPTLYVVVNPDTGEVHSKPLPMAVAAKIVKRSTIRLIMQEA